MTEIQTEPVAAPAAPTPPPGPPRPASRRPHRPRGEELEHTPGGWPVCRSPCPAQQHHRCRQCRRPGRRGSRRRGGGRERRRRARSRCRASAPVGGLPASAAHYPPSIHPARRELPSREPNAVSVSYVRQRFGRSPRAGQRRQVPYQCWRFAPGAWLRGRCRTARRQAPHPLRPYWHRAGRIRAFVCRTARWGRPLRTGAGAACGQQAQRADAFGCPAADHRRPPAVADARRNAKAANRAAKARTQGRTRRAAAWTAGKTASGVRALVNKARTARDRSTGQDIAAKRSAVRKAPARRKARWGLLKSAARFHGRRLLAALVGGTAGLLGCLTTPIGRKLRWPWLDPPRTAPVRASDARRAGGPR